MEESHKQRSYVSSKAVVSTCWKGSNQNWPGRPVTVYFRMFHGHIKYRLEVWSHATGWRELAVRFISSAVYIDHRWPIFIELGVLRLYSQCILSSLSNLKLNLKKFQQGITIILPTAPTDTATWIFPTVCFRSKKKDCFPHLAHREYNHLPEDMKSSACLKFEISLKKWLLFRPFTHWVNSLKPNVRLLSMCM